MHRLKILLIPFLFSFYACDVINPAEDIPAYITIQNPSILVDSLAGFHSNLGLKDAWVFQAGRLLGTFSLPATFPVANRKILNFDIEGGVSESGVSAFRLPYPFWEQYEFTIPANAFEALDTFVVEPVFKYLGPDDIDVIFEEDFEGPNIGFSPLTINDSAALRKTTELSFQDDFSGKVSFDGNSLNLDISSDNFPYFARNIDVWAEVTYKSTVDFTVGIVYDNPAPVRVSEVTYNPSADWNTIYVHLVKMVREAPNDISIPLKLWISSIQDGESGTLFLDNIRVIKFK